MKTTITSLLFIALINVFSFPLLVQKKSNTKAIDALKNESATTIQAGYDAYKTIALNIWDYAELSYFKINKSQIFYVFYKQLNLK